MLLGVGDNGTRELLVKIINVLLATSCRVRTPGIMISPMQTILVDAGGRGEYVVLLLEYGNWVVLLGQFYCRGQSEDTGSYDGDPWWVCYTITWFDLCFSCLDNK